MVKEKSPHLPPPPTSRILQLFFLFSDCMVSGLNVPTLARGEKVLTARLYLCFPCPAEEGHTWLRLAEDRALAPP